MNRCPKIEYGRLSSEIGWIGVNSRTLSSKRAKILGKGVQRMALNRQTAQGGATEATDRAHARGRWQLSFAAPLAFFSIRSDNVGNQNLEYQGSVCCLDPAASD